MSAPSSTSSGVPLLRSPAPFIGDESRRPARIRRLSIIAHSSFNSLIFALSKKQVQMLLDNIVRIKENVMTFTSDDYEKSIQDSISVIREQDDKFKAHKEEIERREMDLKRLHLEQEEVLDDKEKADIIENFKL